MTKTSASRFKQTPYCLFDVDVLNAATTRDVLAVEKRDLDTMLARGIGGAIIASVHMSCNPYARVTGQTTL